MKLFLNTLASFSLFFSAGCATKYESFEATTPTTLSISGVPGAMFAVATGAPGKFEDSYFRILPLGLREVRDSIRLLVRYYFENYEKKAWRMSANFQKAKLKGENKLLPGAWVETGPSEASIPSDYSRIEDVYFEVPSEIRKNEDLEGLEISWLINTASKDFSGTTSFHRVITEEDPTLPSSGKGKRVRH
jgi:hypothetical protein